MTSVATGVIAAHFCLSSCCNNHSHRSHRLRCVNMMSHGRSFSARGGVWAVTNAAFRICRWNSGPDYRGWTSSKGAPLSGTWGSLDPMFLVWTSRGSCVEVKQLNHETSSSPVSGAEVKNGWSFISISFMAWCCDSFIFMLKQDAACSL